MTRASLTVMLALTIFAAAACTSSAVGTGADSGARDDSGSPDPEDSGSTSDTGAGTDAGGGTCPSTTPIDTSSYGWKPPFVSLGKCTSTDLNNFDNYYGSAPNAPYADLKTKSGISATCAGCVFGADGTTWHPFVESSPGVLIEINIGGCMMIASGSEACGKAYQKWFDCRYEACADCPNDTATLNACLAASSNGACKAVGQSITTSCGSSLNTYESKCLPTGAYVFDGALKAQCGSGL